MPVDQKPQTQTSSKAGFLAGGIVLALIALAALPLGIYINSRAMAARDEAIANLEKTLGGSLTYASVSPALLSKFELSGLVFEKEGMRIKVGKASVFFNLIAFFFEERRLQTITKIELDRVDAELVSAQELTTVQTTEAEQLLKAQQAKQSVQSALTQLFSILGRKRGIPYLPIVVSCKQVNFSYQAAWGQLNVENALALISPVQQNYHLELSGRISVELNGVDTISAPVSFTGLAAGDLSSGELALEARDFQSSLISIEKHGLRVAWSNGLLEMRKTIDNMPFDYIARADAQDKSIYFSFSSQKFRPADFVRRSSQQAQRASILSYFNGSGAFLFYPDENVFYYDLNGSFELNLLEKLSMLTIDAAGNNISARIRNLDYKAQEARAAFQGDIDLRTLFPTGTFRIEAALPGNNNIRAEFGLTGQAPFLTVKSRSVLLDGAPLGSLEALISSKNQTYEAAVRYTQAGSQAQVQANGLYDYQAAMGFVDLKLADLNLTRLSEEGILPTFFNGFTASADAAFNVTGSQFFIDGRNFELEKEGFFKFYGAFTADEKQLRVQNIAAESGNFAIRASFLSQLSANPEFSGQIFSQAMSYPFAGSYTNGNLELHNEYGSFTARLKEQRAALNLEAMPLTVEKEAPRLTVDLAAQLGTDWNVSLPQLKLQGQGLDLRIERASFNRNRGRVPSIAYADGVSALKGAASYAKNSNGFDLSADLNSIGLDNESYSARLVYNQDLQGILSIKNFPLTRLGAPGLEGSFSSDMKINSINSLALEGAVSLDGFLNNDRIALSGAISYSEQAAYISRLYSQYGEWQLSGGLAVLGFNAGSLSFSAQASKVDGSIKTGFGLYLQGRPYLLANAAAFFEDDFSGVFGMDPIIVNQRSAIPAFRLQAQNSGGVYSLKGLENINLLARFEKENGALSFAMDNGKDIKVAANALISATDFEASLTQLTLPLSLLNPLATAPNGQRQLGFERGSLEGSLTIDRNLNINGAFELQDALMKTAFVPGATIRLDKKELAIVNNKLQFGRYRIPAGPGAIVMNIEATLNFPRVTYDAYFALEGKRGVPFAFDINNFVKFQGYGSGWARFHGDNNTGYLSGDLLIPSAQGSLGSLTSLLSATETPSGGIITQKEKKPGFNIIAVPRSSDAMEPFRITSGEDFTFYVPNTAIPTIQTTLYPGQTVALVLDLTVNNESESLAYLDGDLKIRRGEINYFGNRFSIKDGGIITFSQDTSFNPMLVFDADMKPQSGSSTTITMHFANQALDTYSPEFTSSDSSQTQNDIMASLGAIFTPGLFVSQDQTTGGAASSSTAEASSSSAFESIIKTSGDLAGEYVSRVAESWIRRIPFIDTVSISTSAISNIALDKLASNNVSGGGALHQTNFFDYLDGTSIYAGTYIGDSLFLQTSVGAKKDTAQTRFIGEGSRLRPTIGLTFQFDTPLFLIDWSFNPVYSNRKEIFARDASISISKTFTFKDWSDLKNQLLGREANVQKDD